jgi:hypothetical protein
LASTWCASDGRRHGCEQYVYPPKIDWGSILDEINAAGFSDYRVA